MNEGRGHAFEMIDAEKAATSRAFRRGSNKSDCSRIIVGPIIMGGLTEKMMLYVTASVPQTLPQLDDLYGSFRLATIEDRICLEDVACRHF